MDYRGIDAFLDELTKAGVSRVFGNPGTTELPLVDALASHPRLDYVLGLHEGPVMAMADGYAMASRSLSVVNLHASCGVGNAMGQLYNAYRQHSPVLVTAGQQDRRLLREGPILAGDLVAVTKPWTRYSAEVHRVDDLGPTVRSAIRAALTPPRGPVFLSLPVDLQQESARRDDTPTGVADSRTRPPRRAVDAAVECLLKARSPVVLAGSRVCDRAAHDVLTELAEQLGAPVLQESVANHGRLGFPSDHPLRGDLLPLWAPEVHKTLEPFDAAVVVGMDLLRQYIYFEPPQPFPPTLKIIHLDEDPKLLNKNAQLEAGLLGDIAESLHELNERLAAADAEAFKTAAAERRARWEKDLAEQRGRLVAAIGLQRAEHSSGEALPPQLVMAAIARALPANAAVVEEAVTTTNTTLEQLGAIKSPDGYFAQRGWTLGWGVGCAIGAKLAWPDRPVVAVIGDGSLMYGVQSVWTAVQRSLPIVIVLCNNGSYRILKSGAKSMQLPNAQQNRFLGMDLAPSIDFVGLAKSLGANALRVASPDELTDCVKNGFSANLPTLIEVAVADQKWEGE